MTFNVSLIQLNGSPKTVKEVVVSVLSSEWPLTPKQLFSKAGKEFGLRVSTQAVYKTLKQLEAEQILTKNNQGYSLNPQWIEKTKSFSEQLSKIYSSNNLNSGNGSGQVFTVSSLYESDLFLLQIAAQNAPEDKNSFPLIMHWSHFWIPLLLSIEDYKKIKDALLKYKVFGLVKGNTLVDKWCQSFWEKHGFNTKSGQDVASTSDLIAYNDMVIQVFYPKELKTELDDFYSSVKNIQDLDIHHLFEKIFQKPAKIQITITKNKELASQLIEQTIKAFKGEKP